MLVAGWLMIGLRSSLPYQALGRRTTNFRRGQCVIAGKLHRTPQAIFSGKSREGDIAREWGRCSCWGGQTRTHANGVVHLASGPIVCGLKFGPLPLSTTASTGSEANTSTFGTWHNSSPTYTHSPGFVVTILRPGSPGQAPVIALPSRSSRVTTPPPPTNVQNSEYTIRPLLWTNPSRRWLVSIPAVWRRGSAGQEVN